MRSSITLKFLLYTTIPLAIVALVTLSLAIYVPEQKFRLILDSQFAWLIGVVTLLLLQFVTSIAFLTLTVTRPVAKLNDIIQQVTAGKPGVFIDFDGNDEIVLLSKNVRNMSQKFASRKQTLHQTREENLARLIQGLRGNYFYFRKTEEGDITYVSPTIFDVLGYTVEQFLGEFAKYLTDNPVNDTIGNSVIRREGRQQVSYEVEFYHSSGSPRRFEITEVPIKDNKTVPTVEGLAHDVTERVDAVERFRDLLEAAPDGMVITDAKGNIVLVNAQTETLFGYTRDELVGEKVEILIPKRYRKSHVQQRDNYYDHQKIRQRRMAAGKELMARRKDGTIFPVEIILSPLQTEEGLIVISAMRDITKRKRAEKKLARRAIEAELIYQATSIAAETLSVEESLQRCVNIICEKMGWPVGHVYMPACDGSDCLQPSDIWYLEHPDIYKVFRKVTQRTRINRGEGLPGRIWECGEPTWIINVQEDDRFPRNRLFNVLGIKGAFGFPIKLKGKVVAVLEFFNREEMTPDKDLLLLVSSVGEQVGRVLERKQAAEDLSESQQFLQGILDNSPALVYAKYADGRYLMINPKWVDVLKKSSDEVIGKTDRELFPKVTAELFRENDLIVINSEAAIGTEETIEIDDGVHTYISLKFPIFDSEGKPYAVCGISTDITDRKRAEVALREARDSAEAANRAKSEFLSNMSHELRTPLNGVLGYAQILQRDRSVSEQQKESLNAIESCGQHLLTLINDVLDLSKIESGGLEIDLGSCNLHQLLKEVHDIVASRAEKKGLELTLDMPPDMPHGLLTDGPKLRQILVNLLGNAVKFTEQGAIDLQVQLMSKDKIAFTVHDTGIGIPKNKLDDIFDPFKQVDGINKMGGTGLGLAISNKLVRAMGGHIIVESEIGQGSRFSFILPFEKAEVTASDEITDDSLYSEERLILGPGQEITVVIADDSDINRNVLIRLLEPAGFKTIEARNGKEVLEILRNQGAPLVLMDIRMPIMNGLEATQEIRKDPLINGTVVIAVTASVFPEFQEQFTDAGCDDFIGKPFKAFDVFKKIEKNLGVKFIESPTEVSTVDENISQNNSEISQEEMDQYIARISDAAEIGDISDLAAAANELKSKGQQARKLADTILSKVASFDFEGVKELMLDIRN